MATTPATSAPAEAPKPAVKTNRLGLQVLDYRGGKTTLCAGCGHNAISERIIDAFYEMGVQPERVMKLSGIGCSSKSPAYFMSRSHSLQQRAWAHAFGRDGRAAGQQHHEGAGRQRRRRYGLHRHGAVRPPDAPQRPDDLHHRRQRRVWADQGPVLRDRRYRLEAEDRRDQRSARRSIPARWRFSWARRLSGARSPATRSSCSRC